MRRFLIVILALLLAACGGDGDKKDKNTNQDAKYGTVEISGAVSGPFTVEDARVDDLTADTGIYTLVLADMENQYSQDMAVLFTVPVALATTGTQSLGQPTTPTAPDVTFATFVDNREGVSSYSGTTGTLTLDSVGETWSGRFEFTATNADGSQSLTASGTFTAVPVRTVNLN